MANYHEIETLYGTKPKIFISSVSAQSQTAQKIVDQLGKEFFILHYSIVSTANGSPKAVCYKMIKSADVFVGLYDHQYGSVLTNQSNRLFNLLSQVSSNQHWIKLLIKIFHTRSIIEWELDTATKLACPSIKIYIEAPQSQEPIPSQKAFLQKVMNFHGKWVKQISFNDIIKQLRQDLKQAQAVAFLTICRKIKDRRDHLTIANYIFASLIIISILGISVRSIFQGAFTSSETNFLFASILAATIVTYGSLIIDFN